MREMYIPPCSGISVDVSAGQTIYVTDVEGGQVADFFAETRQDAGEFLSTGVTIDCNASVKLHVRDYLYSNLYKETIGVSLADEFRPFLYPNQYTWFTEDSEAVAKASELAEGASDGLDVITAVYNYVIENISYDEEKARTVQSGYLPDVDETLESKKGICFDYAALMTAMLRSQGIPTKLEIGYSGDVYHAWISTYLDETGWIDNVIYFDGKSWSLMDPTLAASNSGDAVRDYIGDGANYTVMYSR